MINVKRVKNGFKLNEDYQTIDRLREEHWTFHPSLNKFFIDLTNKQLNILHGRTPTYMFRDIEDKFVIEMYNEYNPSISGDKGGIVVYETDDEKLELYEYFNEQVGTSITYPYVRLIKNGNKYDGYGSQDGKNWDIRGSIYYDKANKYGLALEGTYGDNLKVNYIRIFESTKIKLVGMPLNSYLILNYNDANLTGIGRFNSDNHAVEIDLFNNLFPLNLNFQVYLENGTLFAESNISNVYGGDEFHCGNFLEIYYEGVPLSIDTDFGYINSFYKDFRLEIRNMVNYDHQNVTLQIQKYFNEFGDEWIKVCKDVNGVPNQQFEKSISYNLIPANSSVYFWVRITRSAIVANVDDYIFDFVLSLS